jgi:hypothetical protein
MPGISTLGKAEKFGRRDHKALPMTTDAKQLRNEGLESRLNLGVGQ